MDKRHIIDEIKRTAEATGGVPLGQNAFERETGIKKHDWYGRHWARWSDALREAGFAPNQMQVRSTDEHLIEKLIELTREVGRFPVEGEIRLKKRQDADFPSHTTFTRIGSKQQIAAKVIQYCEGRTGYDDIVAACRPFATALKHAEGDGGTDGSGAKRGTAPKVVTEFVYLMKSGRHYKIGRTNSLGRRGSELAIKIPVPPKTIHSIETDDPVGVEAYWHKRFHDKRGEGEWFELSPEDIRAFKRWKRIV
jgi:hypothetical protein